MFTQTDTSMQLKLGLRLGLDCAIAGKHSGTDKDKKEGKKKSTEPPPIKRRSSFTRAEG